MLVLVLSIFFLFLIYILIRIKNAKTSSDAVLIKGLRKINKGQNNNPNKIAVKDSYYGVRQDHVFGFLGVN